MPVGSRTALANLFPPSRHAHVSIPIVVVILAVSALGAIVGIARQTGVGALDTLYAEDGQIFLGEAVREGTGESLTSPYMGYFHTVPRLVAEAATWLPLRDAATFMAVAAALLLTAIALVVFRASSGHIRSTPIRASLAASVLLLPLAQDEVFNNIANLHWFLMFASAWVLVWNPRTTWELCLGAAVLLLSGMSDPLTALLAPLALIRLLTVRGWRNHVFTIAFAVGVLLQVGGIVLGHAERTGLSPTANVVKLALWYVFYVVARALFGMRFVRDTDSVLARALVGVSLLSGMVVVIRAALGRDERVTVPAAAFAMLSVVFYLAPVAATGLSAPRYAVVPGLLLVSAIACLLDGRAILRTRRLPAPLVGAVGVVVLVAWGANYRLANSRSSSVRWGQEVAKARATCEQAGTASVRVPIAPAGWHVDLPCAGSVTALGAADLTGPPSRERR